MERRNGLKDRRKTYLFLLERALWRKPVGRVP